MTVRKISRRTLLVGISGAAVLAGSAGLWVASGRWRNRLYRIPVNRGDAFAPSVYLNVEPDGSVVIWLTRSEMGQGISTALPMMIAEELDADWGRVRVEQAVAHDAFDFGGMSTVASSSVSSQWTDLRRAGAVARIMLVSAAARHWGVAAESCRTLNGAVLHDATGRSMSYGELAQAAGRERAPLRPRLKSPAEFRLIGRSVPRLDVPAKVTGTTVFGLDVRVENMLHAVLARGPAPGSVLLESDESAARAVPGVIDVVHVGRGVAVLARNTHAAIRGRDALRLRWQHHAGVGVSDGSISTALREKLDAPDAQIAREDAGADAALAAGARVSADYEVPFLAHAPMEPMNCVVRVADGRCEVWAPTQVPDDARQVAAHVAGLPLSNVTVHTTSLGGGFGRRASSDYVAEAVELAARTGSAVQIVWTREDDMRHGLHREAAVQRMEAALGADGMPRAWRHRVVSAVSGPVQPGTVNWNALMGTSDLPYRLGPLRIEWGAVQTPIPTTIWRSVGHSYTAFAIESFIDELAQAAGQDPLDYRLRLLPGSHRLSGCIRRVAEMSGWSSARAGGRALGIAATSCFGSYIALVAELGEDEARPMRVTRIWAAVDCGIAVHPGNVVAQIEGGVIFGLTAALHGKLTIRDGAVVEGNFDSYRLLRIGEAPAIEVDLLASHEAPGGIGEVGVPPVAPAVANALRAAGHGRVRILPLVTA